MKGKGMFREHSHRRCSSGKRVKGIPSNVVIIDVDGDNVLDPAESSQKKFKRSSVLTKDGKVSSQGVINLDDDEDNDVDPGLSVDVDGDLVSDACSTKSRFSAFKTMQNSMDFDADECQVIPEKTSTFQFSKCKQTYRTKASGRNRYALDPEFDNVSTDSDSSDCELMEEGTFGKVREQWERASLKRKHVHPNSDSGSEDPASASSSNCEARTNAEEENGREHVDVPVCSNSSNGNYRKENLSEFKASNGGNVESTAFKSQSESFFMEADQKVEQEKSQCPRTISEEKEKLDSRQSFVSGSRLFEEAQVDNDDGNSEGCSGKACYQDKVRAETNDVFSCDSASNQTQINPVKSCSAGAREPNDRSQLLNAEDGDVTPSVDIDIINEREKLKETDEYKRAIEEEWASRQQQLKLQAEEAQRLRRKKKAESMLKYDIERRQKQRIEEVRETQKKDQENIDLKEQLRVEIRKEINKLEVTCIDMASLLRGLGILVTGGPHPMSVDVHSAYKKALLKFHPDRASRTDIRQQVEAEEKFKLISRMKEKILSTSCY